MMIAAAVQKTTPWWQSLSFSWFDFVFLAVLAFGFWRGRKRGMSREALPASMWLVIVLAAGLGYRLLGDLLLQTGMVKTVFGTTFQENTAAYVITYLAITLIVFIIFSYIGKLFKEKLSGSNAFGSGEYYLGTMSGMIRWICILIFALAFLNAPYYSVGERAESKAYKARWYGGGLKDYNGDFIPALSDVQDSVFKTSLVGPFIKSDMGFLLIASGAPAKKAASAHH